MVRITDISLSRKLICGFMIVILLSIAGYNGITSVNTELSDFLNNDLVIGDSYGINGYYR